MATTSRSAFPLAAHVTWLARATGTDPSVRYQQFSSTARARHLLRSDDAIPDVYKRCRRRHTAYALVFVCIEHGEWNDIVRWDSDGTHILVRSSAALRERLEPLFELLQLGSFTTWWRRNTRRAETEPRRTIDGVRWYRKENYNAATMHTGMAVCDVRRTLDRTRRQTPPAATSHTERDLRGETDWQRIVRLLESNYETGRTGVATSVASVGNTQHTRRAYRCSVCGQPKRGHTCTAPTVDKYEQRVESAIATFLSSVRRPEPTTEVP